MVYDMIGHIVLNESLLDEMRSGFLPERATSRIDMLPPRIIKQVVSIKLLEQSIVRRKNAENALEASRRLNNGLLKESRLLHKSLRYLTHATLSNHEEASDGIGKALQDDIAQTLIGLNVRLLALRKEVRCNAKRLREELSSTQRLVARSASKALRATQAFWSA